MENLYKKVTYVEYRNYFQHRKFDQISNNEYQLLKKLCSDDCSIYRRPTYIEFIISDDDENQIIIKKYQDEWWGLEFNISNGPSRYYILDTLDGLKDGKLINFLLEY